MTLALPAPTRLTKVTDEALNARPLPVKGQTVFAFAPLTLQTREGLMIHREIIEATVSRVVLPEADEPDGVPAIRLRLDARGRSCLDTYEMALERAHGHITRTHQGWFASRAEAEHRNSHLHNRV